MGVLATVSRVLPKIAILSLLCSAGPLAASNEAVLAGVVRDAQGKPQPGVFLELLGRDASVIARAWTDASGRYLLAAAFPGTYELRATAALLVPSVEQRVALRVGVQSVRDLTLHAVSHAAVWLPAQPRPAGEGTEDWKWTLRSTASRPLLRLASDEDDASSPEEIDASTMGDERTAAVASHGWVEVGADAGEFAESGKHASLRFEPSGAPTRRVSYRANVGMGEVGSDPALDAAVRMDGQQAMGGRAHMTLSFASRPELATAKGEGFYAWGVITGREFSLGDLLVIDAGTRLQGYGRSGTSEQASQTKSLPYAGITLHLHGQTLVRYRIAAGELPGGLDSSAKDQTDERPMATLLANAQGDFTQPDGLEQELAVHVSSAKQRSVAELSVGRSSASVREVDGVGRFDEAAMVGLPVLVDENSNSFRLALPTASPTERLDVTWGYALTPNVTATLHDGVRTVLVRSGAAANVAQLQRNARQEWRNAISAALRTRVEGTGTYLEAEYRWQPARVLERVDFVGGEPRRAYLSVSAHQRLWAVSQHGRVELLVEGTNLLRQGYTTVSVAEGDTVSLTQVPRSVRGGLAFSF